MPCERLLAMIKKIIQKAYYFILFRLRSYQIKLLKEKLKCVGKTTSIDHAAILLCPEQISLGDNVSINAFVHIWGHGGVTIGDGTLIASHCSITSLTHDPLILPYKNAVVAKEIIIGKNVWIGSHSVILPGVVIGDNVIIGAGAVVTKDIPANHIVAGVPAKFIRINENA